jgi:uncharacterized Zn finger protein
VPPSDTPWNDGLWNDPTTKGRDLFPPPSKPRDVTGGIRLAKRRASEQSWWSQRWISMFEAIGHGERLLRGRDYATGGQVRTLEVHGDGGVRATVQGTRRTPYDVRITLRAVAATEWIVIADVLASRAAYRAALAAGSLPEDIEAVFARAGVALFPSDDDDVEYTCTCTDWARPCKHVAAVVYLVGDALDRDPLLALQLRGVDREVLTALVAGRAIDGDTAAEPEDRSGVADEAASTIDAHEFWNGPAPDDRRAPIDLEPAAIDAPLIRILGGPPPQWRGSLDFERELTRILRRAATDARTLDVALGAD